MKHADVKVSHRLLNSIVIEVGSPIIMVTMHLNK